MNVVFKSTVRIEVEIIVNCCGLRNSIMNTKTLGCNLDYLNANRIDGSDYFNLSGFHDELSLREVFIPQSH